MSVLRVTILWHQHQPFYKDLVTGEYRLPWVRLHALKDYYGMVKLLDEFPERPPDLQPCSLADHPDPRLRRGNRSRSFSCGCGKAGHAIFRPTSAGLRCSIFSGQPRHLIGRYPRYRELWEMLRSHGDSPDRAEQYFQPQDFTDLQVLSQLAWFDEFFLDDPEIASLVKRGRNYSLDDQRYIIARERELLSQVLPAHADAAKRGSVEISTSPSPPDSSAGVRHQCGRCVLARPALAAKSLPAFRRRQ